MIALPTLRRAVWLTAGGLAAGQLLLAWPTGHLGADLSEPLAAVKGITSLAVVAAIVVLLSGWKRAKAVGKGVRATHRSAKKVAKMAKKQTVLHIMAGSYVCLCLLAGLAGNAWVLVTGHGHWLGFVASFTAFAALGRAAAILVAVLAATAVAIYAANKQLDKRKKQDVHERSVAEILRPTVKEVAKAGLLAEPGSDGETIRLWLGDADLTDTICGIPRVVTRSLYLPDTPTSRKSVGYGVLGLPGAAKWVNTIANLQMRAGGNPMPGGDGHGAGFMGPQVAISNKMSILGSFAWRRELIRTAYRWRHGVDPDDAQIAASGLSIYDPTGMTAGNPTYMPYVKGYSPLDGVTDSTSARTLAQSLLVKDDNMTNSQFFDDAAATLIGGLLLAALRAGHGMRRVHGWVADLQKDADRQAQVMLEVSAALTGDKASTEDAHVYQDWSAFYQRLKEAPGERSAVWGTVQRALAPFSDPRVVQSTDPAGTGHAGGMIDMNVAIDRPYAMTFVLLPGDADACRNARPVVQAFVAALLRAAVKVAERSEPEGLPLPLLIVLDETPSTRVLPNLRSHLETFRAWNIRVVWVAQTISGIESVYGDEAKAIVGTGTATLTYANYGSTTDGHLEEVIRQIGQHQTTKKSTSRSKGKDGGESVNESQERVQAITVDRLRSDLEPDEIILQVNGTAGGKLRPFIIRQNRSVADDAWVEAGLWVDPVLKARLVDGTAAGVVSHGRPARSKWLRPAQRLVWAISDRRPRRAAKLDEVDASVSATEPSADSDDKPVSFTKPSEPSTPQPPVTTDCRW